MRISSGGSTAMESGTHCPLFCVEAPECFPCFHAHSCHNRDLQQLDSFLFNVNQTHSSFVFTKPCPPGPSQSGTCSCLRPHSFIPFLTILLALSFSSLNISSSLPPLSFGINCCAQKPCYVRRMPEGLSRVCLDCRQCCNETRKMMTEGKTTG